MNRWVQRFHSSPNPETRLICLPHAGGSASYYFAVSKAMAPRCEVLAIQYPGRQERRAEPCIDDIHVLAEEITAHLQPWFDRPLALFGHSMGATLAFEIAVRMEAKGIEPLALFASGRRAPSRHRDESVHQRDDNGLLEDVRALNGTNSQLLLEDDVLRMILPAIRADYKAAETYRYQHTSALTTPIYVHIGAEDPKVTAEEAEAWSTHTTGHFELHTHPGGHFYLNTRSAQVIAAVRQAIDRSRLSMVQRNDSIRMGHANTDLIDQD